MMTKREMQDLRELLQTSTNRRVYYRLLASCRLYQSSYEPEGTVQDMTFNEGTRNVGLRLLAEAKAAAPDQFRKMLDENTVIDEDLSQSEEEENET